MNVSRCIDDPYFSHLPHSKTQHLDPYLLGLPVPRAVSPRTDTDVQCEVDQSRRGKHCTPIVYRWRNTREDGLWDQWLWDLVGLVMNALMVTGFVVVLVDTGKGCVRSAHVCRMQGIIGLYNE